MVPEIEYRIDRRSLPVRDSGGLWEVLCSSSDLTLMMDINTGKVYKTEQDAYDDGSIHLDVEEDDCAKACPEDSIKRRWAVRNDSGVSQILMDRYSDEDGKDVKGHEVAWRDVATINSYNDSEWILIALRSI